MSLKKEIEKTLIQNYEENLSNTNFINSLKKNSKEELIKKICLLEASLQLHYFSIISALEDIEFDEIIKEKKNE